MDEKYFNLERQIRSLAEKNQGSVKAEKMQFGIESQIDDLKSHVNKMQSHLMQIEKIELIKHHRVNSIERIQPRSKSRSKPTTPNDSEGVMEKDEQITSVALKNNK